MTTLQTAIDSILKKAEQDFKEDGFFKISSCDAWNWNNTEHEALMQLHENPPKGISIRFSINHGVHDWTLKKVVVPQTVEEINKAAVLGRMANTLKELIDLEPELDIDEFLKAVKSMVLAK